MTYIYIYTYTYTPAVFLDFPVLWFRSSSFSPPILSPPMLLALLRLLSKGPTRPADDRTSHGDLEPRQKGSFTANHGFLWFLLGWYRAGSRVDSSFSCKDVDLESELWVPLVPFGVV